MHEEEVVRPPLQKSPPVKMITFVIKSERRLLESGCAFIIILYIFDYDTD